MKPRRGKTIALACGLGVAAVLAASIVFRKDVAAAWHLHRLRTEEGYFAQIIDARDGSAADLAVRHWAETPEGKQAVVTQELPASMDRFY